jgi:hypothetical protein
MRAALGELPQMTNEPHGDMDGMDAETEEYATPDSEEEEPEEIAGVTMEMLNQKINALENMKTRIQQQHQHFPASIAGPSNTYAEVAKSPAGQSPARNNNPPQVKQYFTSQQAVTHASQPARSSMIQDESLQFGDFDNDSVMTESANIIKALDPTVKDHMDYCQPGPSSQAHGYMDPTEDKPTPDEHEYKEVSYEKKHATESKLRKGRKK